MGKEILIIIIGFVFLVKGADFLVKSTSSIAKKFGISEMLIGLTIVALGTSLPEVFITLTSAKDALSDIIIGNAIGSCVCNFLLVIGITSLIRPIKLDQRIVGRHLPIGLFAMLLILYLGNINEYGGNQIITKGQGILLIILTIIYVIYTVYEEKQLKNDKIDKEILEDAKSKDKFSVLGIVMYMFLGILGLKYGADFVVDNSINIAERFGLSEKFIGMTIIAVGTALPEIVTGIIAAMKDETDLLLGNISGSNILNLFLLIGLGASISPLTYNQSFNSSIFLLIVATVFLQLISAINRKSELDRMRGLSLIIVYILYIVNSI